MNARIKFDESPFFFKFFPKILLALSIGILDDIYKKIAVWLNDMGECFGCGLVYWGLTPQQQPGSCFGSNMCIDTGLTGLNCESQ